MPALSPTMTEGKIMSFHVSVGDQVEAGDSIATVETDKAVMEFEVQDEGFIAWINPQAIEEKVKLGHPCAVLVENEGDIVKFKDFSPEKKMKAPAHSASARSPAPQVESVSAPINQNFSEDIQVSKRIFISPRALNKFISSGFSKDNLFAQLNVLSSTEPKLGSGPENRIIEQDVDSLIQKLKEAPTKPSQVEKAPKTQVPVVDVEGTYKEVELSTMRRVIADRLSQSKREIPHYYLEAELRMDALLEMKKDLQEKAGIKLSVNDFIVKAVAKASKEVPDCNTNFVDNKIRFFENVDVR